jgi:ariadne-1
MNLYLTSQISDMESISKLICPNPSCSIKAEEYEIGSLVSQKTYQKYLEFSALAALKTETKMKWCPNKECGQPIIWEKEGKKIECVMCKTEFCFDCSLAWHEGLECGETAGVEEKDFSKWLKGQGDKVKPCPSCKFGISKSSGCNHMTCTQCNFGWCWLCLGATLGNHYDPGSPCYQLQFSQAGFFLVVSRAKP